MSNISKKQMIIGCLACLVVIGLYVLINRMDKSIPEPVYTTPRQILYGYTLKNITNRIVPKVEFWAYAPVLQTATQKCVSIKSSYPQRVILDALGNQILHYQYENFPPYGTKIVQVQVELLLSDEPNRLAATDNAIYLAEEKYLEVGHPLIAGKASELKKRRENNTVGATFDWVSKNVAYAGYIRQNRGALYALRNKKGDCTEYAHLFVALLRAQKIPARILGGYVCPKNTVLKPQEYHNWAEYLDNGVWTLADPQNKVIGKRPSEYIAMRILGATTEGPMKDQHGFRVEGKGIRANMN